MKRLTKRNSDGSVGINQFRYYNYDDVQKMMQKLADYEDAEEKGLLLRLPCKVGDTVWAITSPINLGFDEGEGYEVFESSVDSITFYKNGKHQIRLYSGGVFVVWYVRFSDFGKMVFLTKAEAEKALEEMGSKT